MMRVSAIAALALLIALDGLTASASARPKKHQPRHRPHYQIHLPPVTRIRCAAFFDSSPCGPDPAMLRLQRPQWHRELAPDPPQSVPSR